MSAPLAGKFQDHYEVLGIDPKSSSDVVQQAISKLAQRYHPNNPETGDAEKFDSVNQAYEILSDPMLRREFDKVKGYGEEEGGPKFSGLEFFKALGRDSGLRCALLCVLYDRRRAKPFTPSLSMRHLENIITATTEEMNLALWYLKQKGLAGSDDKSSLLITVEGMDYLEANRPSPEVIMPFVKSSAAAPAPKPVPVLVPVAAVEEEPEAVLTSRELSLNTLRRVLAHA